LQPDPGPDLEANFLLIQILYTARKIKGKLLQLRLEKRKVERD
jgi:hypothetical protein